LQYAPTFFIPIYMLKQFIPNEYCLKCDICCRFGQKNSVYAPKFLPGECISHTGRAQGPAPTLNKHGNTYICEFFSPTANTCTIYTQHPLDCQLYPFMVTYDKKYENIVLCLDTKCPYVQKNGAPETLDVETQNFASLPHDFIMPYQPDTIKIAVIKNLNGFKALALEHKSTFDEYLNVGANSRSPLQPSTRTFTNIYIWSDLFNILWKIIDGNLCVFYEYKNEFNMLLPPIVIPAPAVELAKPDLNRGGWYIRQPRKDGSVIGRIENIAEDEIESFKKLGLKIHKNTNEYIYLTKDIAELKGNKFASHRAAKNNFTKNNKFTYRPFEITDIDECLALYSRWAKIKMGTGLKPVPIFRDSVYQQLMHESFSAQKKAMLGYEELGLIGRVVEINGKIQAYTFGFEMGRPQGAAPTYCIIFETTDITIKGISQFIFSSFAQELYGLGVKYINAMDDSGLQNLRKTKLSWHPYKVLTNYIGMI